MKNKMKSRNITLTFSDYIHVQDLLRVARNIGFRPSILLDTLETDLNRSEVIASHAVPPHVVIMNTCAGLTDTTTGESAEYTLVFPGEANPQQGKLSILSELGFSVGDTIDWESPEGTQSIQIDRVRLQPEAIGQY